MNNLDKQYQALLQDILDNGVKKQTRNGEVLSIFGKQIKHKMPDGFPLLTGKKMFFKGIVTELLWFLRGDTNIKYLVDNDCHIWDGDAYKNYTKTNIIKNDDGSETHISPAGHYNQMAKEEFINKIKTDDEFSKEWGLKIEERELSLKERAEWLQNNKGYDLLVGNLDHDHIREVVEEESPTKLITLTYNNEKIESYE